MTFECHLLCPSLFDLDIQVHSRNDHRNFWPAKHLGMKHFHNFVCNQSRSLNLKPLNQSILMPIHPYCCTGTSPTRGVLWVTLKDTIRHFVYLWDSIDPIATKHGVEFRHKDWLKKIMDVIRNRAPELQNTQMCSISHNNQLYMLKCKECCPFEV